MHVNRANGLPSDVVYFAMPDREGALWLALDSGLARLEVPSPVSFFDSQDGLPSQPFDMVRVDGPLYVAVQTGVLLPRTGRRLAAATPRFVPSGGQPLAMLVVRQDAADRRRRPGGADHRVQRGPVRDRRHDGAAPSTRPADGTFRAAVSLPSTVDPTRLWVGLFDGIASFRRRGGQWIARRPRGRHHRAGPNDVREPGWLGVGRHGQRRRDPA